MTDEIPLNQEIPQTPPIEAPQEPISVPEPTLEPQTAQMGGNEPLAPEPEPIAKQAEEPEIPEAEPVEKPEPETPSPTEATPPSVPQTRNPIRELLAKVQLAIQTRKKKKMEKIMSMFEKKSKITNDEVEKFLHVSDATATRYLEILEKENKIKQVGKTGKAVSYSKI